MIPPARIASRPPRSLSPSSSSPSGIDSAASSRHCHALAPLALVLAQAPAPALLAAAPPALVLADAWPAHSRQSLRVRWWSQMLPPPHSVHRLLSPDALVLTEAPAPALPAHAPDASGRTDARAPALLAPLPLALLNALSFACMQIHHHSFLAVLARLDF